MDTVKAVDAWAMGVLLFLLTTSKYPFEDPGAPQNLAHTVANVMAGRMRPFPAEMSAGCRSCIMGLLRPDPKQRTTLEELKANPWLASEARTHAVRIGRPENVIFPSHFTPPTLQKASHPQGAAAAAEGGVRGARGGSVALSNSTASFVSADGHHQHEAAAEDGGVRANGGGGGARGGGGSGGDGAAHAGAADGKAAARDGAGGVLSGGWAMGVPQPGGSAEAGAAALPPGPTLLGVPLALAEEPAAPAHHHRMHRGLCSKPCLAPCHSRAPPRRTISGECELGEGPRSALRRLCGFLMPRRKGHACS
ncbi:hypothetical protein FOA52_000670 [Chlamydomonas sp. UWO 241]|nr:hypothetical protein FOA52_000670 [Chlamydomonas sp. UWO 241]